MNIGTPALVHDATIRGSRLPAPDHESGIVADCKSRWMVAFGMYRDQVVFWDPRTNDTSRSKSYTAFKLRKGMNFAQMLGCPMPKQSQKSKPLPGDFNEKVTIKLPERPVSDAPIEPIPHVDGDPIRAVIHKSDTQPAPLIEQTPPYVDGGSVTVSTTKGDLVLDPETGWLVQPAPDGKSTDKTKVRTATEVTKELITPEENASNNLDTINTTTM